MIDDTRAILDLLCDRDIPVWVEPLDDGCVGFRAHIENDRYLTIEWGGDVWIDAPGLSLIGKRYGVGDHGLYRALDFMFRGRDSDEYPPVNQRNGDWRGLHRFLMGEFE